MEEKGGRQEGREGGRGGGREGGRDVPVARAGGQWVSCRPSPCAS